MFGRQFVAAWLIGGGIELAGLAGLMVFPGTPASEGWDAGATSSLAYYAHTGSWSTYQHPSGKYSVVLRSLRPAL